MSRLRSLARWLVFRIPFRFSLTLVALLGGYLFLLSRTVEEATLLAMAGRLYEAVGLGALADRRVAELGAVGVAVLLLFLLGALLAYNAAAVIYRKIRKRPSVRVTPPAEPSPGVGDRLAGFDRIGLILAGGGAKGAYQAGALKAIHEFLEEHDALDRVRMVAGTSIGAWNAMFWLAGLVKEPAGEGASVHERWWREIAVDRIVEFDTYVPARDNHFLRAEPWRETFREIFVRPPEVRSRLARLFTGSEGGDPPIHFYLTRSNVERGHLEFSTNWPGLADRERRRLGAGEPGGAEPLVPPDRYEIIAGADPEEALERTRRAVFASMDLPPFFPYKRIRGARDEWFEDGGVVDNLPIRFGTQVEECDLLFVLPLNASFAEPVNHASITKRLFRVMDVRQGVMERSSLKLVYLYNEMARLARELKEHRADDEGPEALVEVRSEHEPVSIFSIVPEAPLAIGTAEFWKADAAGEAFDLLYEATRNELEENFERYTDPNWIRMTRVGPLGERTWFDDF